VPRVKPTVRPPQPAQQGAVPPRFGSHLSIAGGVYKAIEDARRLTFDTVQIFVKNQRQWSAPPQKAEDVEKWRSLAADGNFGPTAAHATYLINLAAGDDALHEKSQLAFADELRRCDALGVPYLVLHPGAAGEQPREVAIGRVADALNRILAELPAGKTMPLLETTAGQGTTLGRTFEDLAEIIGQLKQPKRVAVCADTCHLFAAGYDIRSPAGYEETMAQAEKLLGVGRILCWHLNDSRGDLGSRLDRHEHVGQGKIGIGGFENVLRDRRWGGVPMFLETPKELDDQGREWDSVNLATLRSIWKGGKTARSSGRK
jgi:deoxyribonuclease-4